MTHLPSTLALALFSSVLAAHGQKSPMGLPENWKQVKYDVNEHKYVDETGAKRTDYEAFRAGKPANKDPWRVFTDREHVPLFDKPDGARVGAVAQLSTRLYVYKEDGPYVLVSTEAVGPAKTWCRKRDLVLWHTPLSDHVTGIELKAFVVNTPKAARYIAAGTANKEKYDLMAGPSPNATKLNENFLYDVLFVYKDTMDAASGTGYYLVSDEPELSAGEGQGLLGWINASRVRTWETRLCLEPNFDAAAMSERLDKHVQAKLFREGEKAELDKYLNEGGGQGVVDGPSRDPAFGDDHERSPRMDGKLFRYPVMGAGRSGLGEDNCRFQTGVSGQFTISSGGVLEDLSAERLHALKSLRDKLKQRLSDVNLVFVIDGSLGCDQHLRAARTIVETLANQRTEGAPMSLSAVIYRNELSSEADPPADPEVNYREVIGPVNSFGQFIARLDGVVPRNQGDPSDQRAVHYAFKRAFELCEEGETNIVVHFGNRPDNTVVHFFNSQKPGGGTRVEASELGEVLGKGKGVNFLSYVTWADPKTVALHERERLFDGLTELMQNLANGTNNVFGGGLNYAERKRDAEASYPVELRIDGLKTVRMARLPYLMKTHFIADKEGNAMLLRSVKSNIDSCLLLNKKLFETLDKHFANDSKIADYGSDFTQRNAMELLLGDYQDPAERERMRDVLLAEKVQIFIDTRTVYKAAGLERPIFRYVLFYRDVDLDAQISQLKELNRKLDSADPATVNAGFQEYWRTKARRVLGSGYKADMQVTELMERLQGIQQLDMVKPFAKQGMEIFGDITIQDLEKGKKLAPDQFTKYQALVLESLKALTDLRNQPYYYESADGGSKFYWVPIEYLFI